jgi:hypothetical protein
MSMPGGPSAFAPIRADREVSGSFRNEDGTSISVEAVCKVTEDSLICKGPDGRRNKDLEAKLDKLFRGRQDPYSPSLSFKYKKKNRLILFRKEIPMRPTGPSAFVSIFQAGEEPTIVGPNFLNVTEMNPPFTPEGPRVEYEMRAVAVPFNQNRVDVYISSTKQEPLKGMIALKEGAKLVSGKASLTFSSIKSVSEGFGPGSKAWEVTFRVTRPNYLTTFNLSPVIHGSQDSFAMVDENGNLFENASTDGPTTESGRRRGIRTAIAMPVAITNHEMKVRTNVNPKQLDGFKVILLRTEIVKLKNVPLD